MQAADELYDACPATEHAVDYAWHAVFMAACENMLELTSEPR